jgi:CHAT domain-containing protein/Tfp pilus assembly protein PilF
MAHHGEHPSVSVTRNRPAIYRDVSTFLGLFIILSLLAVLLLPPVFGRSRGPIWQSTSETTQSPSGSDHEQEVRGLEPGKAVKREMAAGQEHIYQIRLNADQFLKAVVEQDGIDVVIRVLEPDGKQILEFDSEMRLREREEVPLVAESTGDYRLTVQPAQKGAATGGYQIRIEELRSATDRDRVLQEARRLYQENLKLRNAGKYDEALSLAARVLDIRERILGTDHSEVAAAINGLAVLYFYKGENAKAESFYLRALEIRERALGPDHPSVADSLNNLAIFCRNGGNYAKAESLCQRALGIRERALGPEHPDVADSLFTLASLNHETGALVRAEPLYRRALAIWEKTLGQEHPRVAYALNGLGGLSRILGSYAKAEPLYQRALAINQKALGPEHPSVAINLNNLANLYSDMGDYAKAEPLYQRALAINQRARGPGHPSVADQLHNLAELYLERGDYTKAEPFYQRVLVIREKTLGPQHPDVSHTLKSLAQIYRDLGEYSKAEPLYQRALASFEKALGPQHILVAESLYGLALLYAAKGDLAQAITFQSRASAIGERNLALNLAAGSERQKLALLARFSRYIDFTLSLHSRYAPNDPRALDLAFTTLLRNKGRGLDAMTNAIAILRRHAAPEDQKLFDQLAEARSQLAMLILRESATARPDTYRTQLKLLEEKVETLESDLSARSTEFRAQSQPVTLSAVQAALPAGAALIEFTLFTPRNLQGGKSRPPRYLAYLLPAQGPPQWVDLGEAEPIDRAIEEWRKALRRRPDVKELGRELDEKVMRPVRALLQPSLGETRRLLIAPDGSLSLIPFAALVDEHYHYLVEDYTISYLTSGRDLLRLQRSEPSQSQPLVMANPVFGRVAAIIRQAAQRTKNSQAGDQGEVDSTRISFRPLPGTQDEALAIKSVMPEASVLLRGEATEAALKQVKSPRLLHIATHGFFLSDQETAPVEPPGAFGDSPLHISDLRLGKWAAHIKDPLLRSGLALSGANQSKSGEDDGLVTALEAASLDLWGTKLVVLSACETGVGEVKNGEGVQGLRRALVLAGSESQVMSLWPVSDTGAKEAMIGYYRALRRGAGRSDGLRQVQLQMLQNRRRQHPFYWAAFIQSGAWANLED